MKINSLNSHHFFAALAAAALDSTFLFLSSHVSLYSTHSLLYKWCLYFRHQWPTTPALSQQSGHLSHQTCLTFGCCTFFVNGQCRPLLVDAHVSLCIDINGNKPNTYSLFL